MLSDDDLHGDKYYTFTEVLAEHLDNICLTASTLLNAVMSSTQGYYPNVLNQSKSSASVVITNVGLSSLSICRLGFSFQDGHLSGQATAQTFSHAGFLIAQQQKPQHSQQRHVRL